MRKHNPNCGNAQSRPKGESEREQLGGLALLELALPILSEGHSAESPKASSILLKCTVGVLGLKFLKSFSRSSNSFISSPPWVGFPTLRPTPSVCSRHTGNRMRRCSWKDQKCGNLIEGQFTPNFQRQHFLLFVGQAIHRSKQGLLPFVRFERTLKAVERGRPGKFLLAESPTVQAGPNGESWPIRPNGATSPVCNQIANSTNASEQMSRRGLRPVDGQTSSLAPCLANRLSILVRFHKCVRSNERSRIDLLFGVGKNFTQFEKEMGKLVSIKLV